MLSHVQVVLPISLLFVNTLSYLDLHGVLDILSKVLSLLLLLFLLLFLCLDVGLDLPLETGLDLVVVEVELFGSHKERDSLSIDKNHVEQSEQLTLILFREDFVPLLICDVVKTLVISHLVA